MNSQLLFNLFIDENSEMMPEVEPTLKFDSFKEEDFDEAKIYLKQLIDEHLKKKKSKLAKN